MAGGLIQTYTDLTAAILEYIARDQDPVLIARIPWFVQSCESKLNRTLLVRQMENRQTALTTTGVDSEYITVPADFQTMRRVRLTGVSGRPQLDYMSATQMEDARTESGDVPGKPKFYTFTGNEIELYPVPDAAYNVELVYRQYLPALGAANATNWLLTLAPDIYLYGSLLESAPYIKKDARLATWAQLYASAVKDLNDLETTENFNAGSLRVRPEGFNVF